FQYIYRDIITAHQLFFFSLLFNDPSPTQIYTLSLHDALPISPEIKRSVFVLPAARVKNRQARVVILNDVAQSVLEEVRGEHPVRSEEHTSELQSQSNLVCRLLLEKKKKKKKLRLKTTLEDILI